MTKNSEVGLQKKLITLVFSDIKKTPPEQDKATKALAKRKMNIVMVNLY